MAEMSRRVAVAPHRRKPHNQRERPALIEIGGAPRGSSGAIQRQADSDPVPKPEINCSAKNVHHCRVDLAPADCRSRKRLSGAAAYSAACGYSAA